ncbi:MAG: polysaccharide deacetylase family protein [Planctomycetes bacterium]|nr:polysaccharide deacetylase family protein [Planctomycetota bacterium]
MTDSIDSRHAQSRAGAPGLAGVQGLASAEARAGAQRRAEGPALSRRRFLGVSASLAAGAVVAGDALPAPAQAAGAAVAGGAPRAGPVAAAGPEPRADPPASAEGKALVAITLDLEMARNFPRWEDTHWDYEKGNLNEETKRYAVEAARRVKARGGVIHFFAVGRALEQEKVDWLQDIVRAGHPVGNHTYDHVYVLATKPEEIQYRFQRAPWLIEGKTPAEVIRENIRLTTAALKARLGIEPAGFRTPGGFANGLEGRPDVQRMLLELGFPWVSCKYPAHPYGEPGKEPAPEVLAGIVKAQEAAQPFAYPTGLIDVPMSPISDIGAFRNARWKLARFLEAVRLGVEWAIERRAVFDLLCHPSVMYVMDPEMRAFELVCDLVERARDRAALADLGTIASRVAKAKAGETEEKKDR